MQATNAHAAGEHGPQVSFGRESARQFDDVLSRCLPSFQRMALRKLGNTADAEDAVQDALLSAYKHLDQFQGGAQMSTWMTSIVINSAWMVLRKRSRHIEVSLDEPYGDEHENVLAERLASEAPSPEDVCRESELHERLSKLLTQLSAPLRRAFELRDLEGLSTHEAALILGVPDGTVKAQLARARASLSQLMSQSLAKSSSAPLRVPLLVTTIKAKRTRTRVTSTVRNQGHRVLPRRGALRGQISGGLEDRRRVA